MKTLLITVSWWHHYIVSCLKNNSWSPSDIVLVLEPSSTLSVVEEGPRTKMFYVVGVNTIFICSIAKLSDLDDSVVKSLTQNGTK